MTTKITLEDSQEMYDLVKHPIEKVHFFNSNSNKPTTEEDSIRLSCLSGIAYSIEEPWKHYKGGLYFGVGIAIDQHTNQVFVLYCSFDDCSVIWARPSDSFFGRIPHNNLMRFERLER